MNKLLKLIPAIIVMVFLYNCSSNKKPKEEMADKIDKELEIDDEFIDDFHKAKQVFYALPSPIETALLIKKAGTDYKEDILNPTSNADKYTTSVKKALNFGVYGADMSYASLFAQNQTAMKYMGVSKKLADEMGMLGYIDKNLVDRLELNISNRDSCMEIITEGFVNSNYYLKETGRPQIAALVIAGGWIEGLYIATKLAQASPNNNELIDRIIDQKLSLNTLVSLLEEYQDDAETKKVLNMVYEIRNVYNKVQVVTSKVEPVTNQESKVTTLQAKTEIFISEEIFRDLVEKIDSIRNSIIE